MSKIYITPRSDLKEAEYKVNDGWQSGLIMFEDEEYVTVWDEHRMQCAEVPHSEWRYKVPRDDAGNPK